MVYFVNLPFFTKFTQQTNPQALLENRKRWWFIHFFLFSHFHVKQPASCGPSVPGYMHTAALVGHAK